MTLAGPAARGSPASGRSARVHAVLAVPPPVEGDARLDALLSGLPWAYRVFILHHLDGCSLAEGARIQGCSVGTFAARVSRGRDLLRARAAQTSAAAADALLSAAESSAPATQQWSLATAQLASAIAAGHAAAAQVPSDILRLLAGAAQRTLVAQLKIASAAALALATRSRARSAPHAGPGVEGDAAPPASAAAVDPQAALLATCVSLAACPRPLCSAVLALEFSSPPDIRLEHCLGFLNELFNGGFTDIPLSQALDAMAAAIICAGSSRAARWCSSGRRRRPIIISLTRSSLTLVTWSSKTCTSRCSPGRMAASTPIVDLEDGLRRLRQPVGYR